MARVSWVLWQTTEGHLLSINIFQSCVVESSLGLCDAGHSCFIMLDLEHHQVDSSVHLEDALIRLLNFPPDNQRIFAPFLVPLTLQLLLFNLLGSDGLGVFQGPRMDGFSRAELSLIFKE
jgi:hypothetical protein